MTATLPQTLPALFVERTLTGTFLINAGNSGCIPSILAYVSTTAQQSSSDPIIFHYAKGANNVVSQSKRLVTEPPLRSFAQRPLICPRSVQTAVTVAFGGIGGILASTVFREQDYPRYLPGSLNSSYSVAHSLIRAVRVRSLGDHRLSARHAICSSGDAITLPAIEQACAGWETQGAT